MVKEKIKMFENKETKLETIRHDLIAAMPEDWVLEREEDNLTLVKKLKIGIYEDELSININVNPDEKSDLIVDLLGYENFNSNLTFTNVKSLFNYLNKEKWIETEFIDLVKGLNKNMEKINIIKSLVHKKYLVLNNVEDFTLAELKYLDDAK